MSLTHSEKFKQTMVSQCLSSKTSESGKFFLLNTFQENILFLSKVFYTISYNQGKDILVNPKFWLIQGQFLKKCHMSYIILSYISFIEQLICAGHCTKDFNASPHFIFITHRKTLLLSPFYGDFREVFEFSTPHITRKQQCFSNQVFWISKSMLQITTFHLVHTLQWP